jgi:Cu(I)/Ag(I) efflux system membrane fusion protein
MKTFLVLLLIAAAATGGWFAARHWHAPESASENGIIYTCSMHPQVRAKKPSKCPFCGMELVPLGQVAKAPVENGVMLSSNRVNAIHVQTVEAQRQPLRRTMRVAGTIDDNDATHRVISAYIDGRIDKLFVNFVGAEVVKGQPLATFFSPTILSAEREYLALTKRTVTNPSPEQVEEQDRLVSGLAQRLRQLGLTQTQIQDLAEKNPANIRTEILAPLSGTVVMRNVYEGQYVKEGEKLFEISDFSTMWFKFDAYERDLPWIRKGQDIEITTPAAPGKTFAAKVSFIDPNINDPTRSAKVRVEIPNPIIPTNSGSPGRALFHRIFAEALVKVEVPEVLAVPRTAVIATGTRTLVYLDRGNGVYEQRPVKLGRAGDDLWEVLEGLSPGDRIVTTGNLLVDAQAQLDLGGSTIPAESGKPMPELDEQQQTSLQNFLRTAASISAALASDNLPDYKQNAAKVPPTLQALKAAFTNSPSWQPLIEKINAVAPPPEANDLADARKAFLPFTTATVELAKIARQQTAFRSVKIFKCPMAPKPGQTSFWIQLAGPLRNPFYGSEMIDCGSEVGL